MSTFPTKILLALDGSEEADAAARMAVELAERTDSELHVVHVGQIKSLYHPEQRGYITRYEIRREHAGHLLDEQVEKVKQREERSRGPTSGRGLYRGLLSARAG